ncbi:MAG: helix-turn-helix domain-containing protein [Nitrospirota bacterium]
MESLGQYLRAQRGAHGVSLEEVATRTRIRMETLEALERDNYASLPAEVTVKGFLRSYARCLGLDERDVMARYQQYAAEYFQIAHEADPVKRVVEPDRSRVLQHRLTAVGLVAAGVMVVVSAVTLWGPRAAPEHPTAISAPLTLPPPAADAPPAEEPATSQPDAAPPLSPSAEGAGVAISAPPSPAPAANPQPAVAAPVQRLVITASEPAWVQAIVDETETHEALMQPGQRVEWTAQKHFRLTVGNAGGVSIEVNGEAWPSLGASGRVRTLVLPRGAVTAPAPAPKPVAAAPRVESSAEPQSPPALTSPTDSTTVPIQPL